jgi:hypothetical protein
VHPHAQDPKLFDLIMAWKPTPTTDSAYTWFKATIGPDGAIPASLHLGVEPSLQALKAHYGEAYTRPFDPCQIDAFGNLHVVPWIDAYPPSGHARKIPD